MKYYEVHFYKIVKSIVSPETLGGRSRRSSNSSFHDQSWSSDYKGELSKTAYGLSNFFHCMHLLAALVATLAQSKNNCDVEVFREIHEICCRLKPVLETIESTMKNIWEREGKVALRELQLLREVSVVAEILKWVPGHLRFHLYNRIRDDSVAFEPSEMKKTKGLLFKLRCLETSTYETRGFGKKLLLHNQKDLPVLI